MIVTRNLSKQGAIVIEGRHRIPELAQITLDKWALKRVQDLRVVTKAHKYTFPFHDRYNQKRAYRKIFEIVKKQLERQIPYITTALVDFINIGNPVSEVIVFNVGPCTTVKHSAALLRYVRVLNRLIRREGLPMTLSPRLTVSLTSDGQRSINVLEIKAMLNRITITDGYLILYHLPHIIKAVETLHRKAVYAA